MITAELLMLISGISAFILTVYWVRKRELKEKYAIVWLGVASFFLILGLFPDILKGFAKMARLSFPASALFFALGMIYIFAFSVSVSLSRLSRRNLRLIQECALLEQRVRDLEKNPSKHEETV